MVIQKGDALVGVGAAVAWFFPACMAVLLSLNLFTRRVESMVIVIHYTPPRKADKEPPLTAPPFHLLLLPISRVPTTWVAMATLPCVCVSVHRCLIYGRTRTLRCVKKWKGTSRRRMKGEEEEKEMWFTAWLYHRCSAAPAAVAISPVRFSFVGRETI